MRVLLGAAMVAGASASMTLFKAEYDTVAAAADPVGVTWPTEVTDAAITTYDGIVDTQTTALVAALDKQTDGAADPDYTAAKAALTAITTGCGAVQALWATAMGTGGSAENWTDAQKLALATNMSAASVALAGKIRGKCQVTGSDPATWHTAAADGTEDGEFEDKAKCEATNKGAGNNAAGTWVPEADNATAATHSAALAADMAAGNSCTFGKGGADLAAMGWWAQRPITTAEAEAMWPAPVPASASADDGSAADPPASAASPAYALAAGAAAVLALLF